MSSAAHIFTPSDDSIESRVAAYRRSLALADSAERSKALAGDPEWTLSLGDADEIDFAHCVSLESLKTSAMHISPEELKTLESSAVLEKHEIQTLRESHAQLEMQAMRDIDPDIDLDLDL